MAGRELLAIFRAKDEMSKEISQVEGNIGQMEHRFEGISGKAIAAGAAFGVALTAAVALGKGMYDLGAAFDDAADSILIKSGAVGDTLEQLNADFMEVVKNVPTSFENAATAIGLLHARTGQAGEGLQALTEQMLNLSRLTGSDVSENIRTTTRVFGDWGIAVEEQSVALDKLFRAAQMSGSSVSELSQRIVQFGAPMRQLGIEFEDAVALMAKWEKEGVNVETVAGTMRIALAKMAEAGLDPSQTFERLINTIRDMEDPIEATGLAMEIFGKRGGADMAAAIREGRFAIDEYKGALEEAGGAINDAAAKTDDAKQQMEKAFNELKVAAEPVVKTVFEALNAAMTAAVPLMKEFATNLSAIAELFKRIGSGQITGQDLLLAMMGVNAPGSGGMGPRPDFTLPARPGGLPVVGGPEPGPEPGDSGPGAPAPGLTAAEIAALRKDEEAVKAAAKALRDAQREAERARKAAEREAEREAKAAVREAERILKEQQRQAEREAELEAQRINTIRDLGEKRAKALEDAEDAYVQAWQKALDKEEEQITRAQAQFRREQELREEREFLQQEAARQIEQLRENQSARSRETSDSRTEEDRGIRRAREDADLLTRQAQRSAQTRQAEEQDQARINAARFAGDSRAVTAAMLAAEQRKKAVKDQSDAELAALTLRRQREDEDVERMRTRRTEDLALQKEEARQMADDLARINEPLRQFNQKIVEDNLAEKITGYVRAKEEALIAAENLLGTRQMQAELQFQQGVERANNIGVRQTVILNNYNSGFQGSDAIDQALEELLERAADRLGLSA